MIGIEQTRYSAEDIERDIETLLADPEARATIERYHQLWYGAKHTWSMTTWQGRAIMKCPNDLLILQEIIHAQKPALIVETGSACGGSALFFAHLCDLNQRGRVLSVDLDFPNVADLPDHPRLTFVKGSSVDPRVVEHVWNAVAEAKGQVFISLDSDHRAQHVYEELVQYTPMIPVGGLLLVEDTNVNGHPVLPEFGPGPYEAVEAFLETHPNWERCTVAERFLLSMHPGGWLRRRA